MSDIAISKEAGWRPLRFDGTPFPKNWPSPLGAAAYHGVTGEMLRLLEPETEADPAACGVQFLVGFGNMIGRTAHFRAAGASHHTNLFAVIVGESGSARKGSSWEATKGGFLTPADHGWGEECVKQGLSSGEGLIYAVRDPVIRRVPRKEGGRIVGYDDFEEDPGVLDKRLQSIEPEFAGVLRVAAREGNTLSTWLRQAWDGQKLGTLTKKNPMSATGAHISMLGHITVADLRHDLTRTDTANGFANRYLWVAATRSKLLPEGGRLSERNIAPITRAIQAAAVFARSCGEMRRDAAATELWHEVYPQLTAARGGLYGAATGRAEAQVMRIAVIYAVLDRATEVRIQHLQAALEVWDYCQQSARWVFGDATGNRTADKIKEALESASGGLSRTAINELFHGHQGTEAITDALAELRRLQLAEGRTEGTGGRPAERWYAGCGKSGISGKRVSRAAVYSAPSNGHPPSRDDDAPPILDRVKAVLTQLRMHEHANGWENFGGEAGFDEFAADCIRDAEKGRGQATLEMVDAMLAESDRRVKP